MHALSWIAVRAFAAQSPTRAVLAAAYLRFERVLRDHPPTESVRVEVERPPIGCSDAELLSTVCVSPDLGA